MPGIASQPTQTIDPSAIAAIGQDRGVVTPPLEDLMAAFRSGFLTVDDLTKRALNKPVETAQRGTALQANDLQRKQIAAQESLLPGQVASAQEQQRLETVTAPAKAAAVTKQARDLELLTADPDAYHAEKTDEALRQAYIQRKGRLPESLTIKNSEKPLSFVEWTQQNLPEIQAKRQAILDANTFPDEVSGEKPEYEAEMLKLNDSLVQDWQKYVRESQTVKVSKGSPEYAQALHDEVSKMLEQEAIRGAKAKALPGILEAQAKATTEGPAKSQALAQSNRKDYSALDEIAALRKVDAAYRKVKTAVTSESSPFQDMSAIFGFMKVLDPGSTVREGEYATAENARAVPETIKNFYNKVVSGTKLTPEQRTQLLTATEGNLRGQVQNAAPRIRQYLAIETDLGLTPGEVVPAEDAALLTNLTAAVPGQAAPGFQGAKRVVQNGVTFEWNGTNYAPVQ